MADVRGARIAQLVEDPAIGGDLLLVGVALVSAFDFDTGVFAGHRSTLQDIADRLWPQLEECVRLRKVEGLLRRDSRTYRPERGPRQCAAPAAHGTRICGQRSSRNSYITDWVSGQLVPLGACREHEPWYDHVRQDNLAAKPADPPLPYANHGGELRRHFPELQWPILWRHLDPHWVEYPEKTAWPRPILRLVVSDGDNSNGSARPLLTPVSRVVS